MPRENACPDVPALLPQYQFQVDQIMFLVLLVAVFAYIINLALARLERRFESWRGVA